MTTDPRSVALLGAGPVGLDAALACADAGLPYTLYEAGPTVTTHVRDWAHVRLTSPRACAPTCSDPADRCRTQ